MNGWFYRLEFEHDTAYAYSRMKGQPGAPMCSYQEANLAGRATQAQVCTWDSGGHAPTFRSPTRDVVSIYVDGRLLRVATVYRLEADEFVHRTHVLPDPPAGRRWGVSFVDEHERHVCVVGYDPTPDELIIVSTRGDHFPNMK